MPAVTNLVLSPNGVPPYSARGLTQSLVPIDAAKNFRRTVNGKLVSLAPDVFQLYRSTIECNDIDPAATDGIKIGSQLVVDCTEELSFLTLGGAPARTVVDGSLRTDGDFTFYRPQLTMLVVDFELNGDEFMDKVSWRMVLEELGGD